MSSNGILTITDGTAENTARLLVTLKGTHLTEWFPKAPQPLTVIQASSPYLDGKHLITKTYDNVVDTFIVDIDGDDINLTIAKLSKFYTLLEKATHYWMEDYNTHKFWLEIKGECEENTRYALIVDYSIPEGDNPFEAPFAVEGASTLEGEQLIIEHTIWQDNITIGNDCVSFTNNERKLIHKMGVFRPSISTDDCYVTDPTGLINTAGTEIIVGEDNAGVKNHFGVRFRNLNVPHDAQIVSAYVRVVATNVSGGTVSGALWLEKNATPATFSTYADFMGRSLTDGIAFNIPSQVVDQVQYFYEIWVPLEMMEVVTLPGWVGNNDLAMFMYSNGPANRWANFASLDHATKTEPILVVWWVEEDEAMDYGTPTPTCERKVVTANYERTQEIDVGFVYDDSAGTYTSIIVDSGVNYNLLPATPAVGDILYLGITDTGMEDTAPTYSGAPVSGVMFNLSQAMADVDGTWEIYNGAAWVAATKYHLGDYTAPEENWFLATGEYWTYVVSETSTPSEVNFIRAWWLRFRVTAIGAAPVPPKQLAHTVPYSPNKPYITIASDEILGDLPAYLDFLLAPQIRTMLGSIIVSARKARRDANFQFTPEIPPKTTIGGFTDWEYNGTDWVGSYAFGSKYGISSQIGTEVLDGKSPFGFAGRWSPAIAADDVLIGYALLDAATYAGRYRVFMRARVDTTTAIGEMYFYLRTYTDAPYTVYQSTRKVYNKTTNFIETIDLGIISFAPEYVLAGPYVNFKIELYGGASGASQIDIYDLYLIPVDEMSLEIIKEGSDLWSLQTTQETFKIITSDTKLGPYVFSTYILGLTATDPYADQLVVNWNASGYELMKIKSIGPFAIEPKEEYRIYIFTYCNFYNSYSLQSKFLPSLDKTQRYMLYRGKG